MKAKIKNAVAGLREKVKEVSQKKKDKNTKRWTIEKARKLEDHSSSSDTQLKGVPGKQNKTKQRKCKEKIIK